MDPSSHPGQPPMPRSVTPPPLPRTEPGAGSPAQVSKKRGRLILWFLVLVFFCSGLIFHAESQPSQDPVARWRPYVEEAARRYGIDDHMPELMAILEVESGGQGEDIFQSSESLGLDPNSLDPDASIEQGVSFYASLLEEAKERGTDRRSVWQAYNYGRGYLQYVAEHGGVHTQELVEAFAKEHSGGVTVSYPNPVALEANGGWRYNYGNMFYTTLVEQAMERQQQTVPLS